MISLVGLAALVYWDLIDNGQVSLALALVPAAFLGKLASTTLLEKTSARRLLASPCSPALLGFLPPFGL